MSASSGRGTIPATAFGLNTAVYDGFMNDTPVAGLMRSAGIGMLRYIHHRDEGGRSHHQGRRGGDHAGVLAGRGGGAGVERRLNHTVLPVLAPKADFVVFHWYPGGSSPADMLTKPSLVAGATSQLRALIDQFGGAHAPDVQIMVTETTRRSR